MQLYYKVVNGRMHYGQYKEFIDVLRGGRNASGGWYTEKKIRKMIMHVKKYTDLEPVHQYSAPFDDSWSPLPSEHPMWLIEGIINEIEEANFYIESSCTANSDHDTIASIECVKDDDRDRLFLAIFDKVTEWLAINGEPSIRAFFITEALFSWS